MTSTQSLIGWLVSVTAGAAIVLSIIFVLYADAAGGKAIDKACIENGHNYQKVDIVGDNTKSLIKVCVLNTPIDYGDN